jgi:hypothetical protein
MSRPHDPTHFDNPDEERDWRQLVYTDVVSNQRIHRHAWELTLADLPPGIPKPTRGQFETARGYLLSMAMRKPIDELRTMSDETWAALWAYAAHGRAERDQHPHATSPKPRRQGDGEASHRRRKTNR